MFTTDHEQRNQTNRSNFNNRNQLASTADQTPSQQTTQITPTSTNLKYLQLKQSTAETTVLTTDTSPSSPLTTTEGQSTNRSDFTTQYLLLLRAQQQLTDVNNNPYKQPLKRPTTQNVINSKTTMLTTDTSPTSHALTTQKTKPNSSDYNNNRNSYFYFRANNTHRHQL
ncbi:hypothetical protein QQF64_003066 [Cirrhinus molitorella]|uniref:Uncharacterized protein n=1 Tax=Cirrhinus molitorella TaxID=172907 RepID=A0ABR3MIY1_9TELE